MKNIACSDCVVTAMLGPIPTSLEEHKEVLDVLAGAGLVSPLRLVIGLGCATDEHEEPGSYADHGAIAQ